MLSLSLAIYPSIHSFIFTNTLIYSINTHWLYPATWVNNVFCWYSKFCILQCLLKIYFLLKGRCLFSVPYLSYYFIHFLFCKVILDNSNKSQNYRRNFNNDLDFSNVCLNLKEKTSLDSFSSHPTILLNRLKSVLPIILYKQ